MNFNNSESSFEKLKKLRIDVLEKNQIGTIYKYDLTGNKDCNLTEIKYLGTVTTNKNKQYKILNSFFVTGNSCRGISRIVKYNTENQYIGNYYVGMPYDLPDTLIGNTLMYTQNIRAKRNKAEHYLATK